MSVKRKLVHRLLSRPRDMTPDELIRLLGYFGYVRQPRGGGGSHYVCRKAGAGHLTVPTNVRHLKVAYLVEAIRLLGLEEEDEQ